MCRGGGGGFLLFLKNFAWPPPPPIFPWMPHQTSIFTCKKTSSAFNFWDGPPFKLENFRMPPQKPTPRPTHKKWLAPNETKNKRDLDYDLDYELDSHLDCELDSDLDCELDRDLDCELDRDLDRDLECELDSDIDCELNVI